MSAQRYSITRSSHSDEPQLTPAASETLEDNIEQVRQQILREIARRYRHTEYRARVSDVESAVRSINSIYSASQPIPRKTILAIVLSLITLAVQLFLQINKPTEVWFNTGISLMVGVTTGTALVVITQESRRRTRIKTNSAHDFLVSFRDLEDHIRARAREVLGEMVEGASLGRVISSIELMQLWTSEDSQAFRRLLGIRNSIVHEDSPSIPVQEIASGYSEIARLSALLANESRRDRKLKGGTQSRAGLMYEERVVNALRRGHLDLFSSRIPTGYDFVLGQDESVRIVVKYRRSGLLVVADIADVFDKAEVGTTTIVISNAPVSRYVADYLELSRDRSGSTKSLKVITWDDGDDSESLLAFFLPFLRARDQPVDG